MADYTDPQFWPQLKQLAATIDTLDYFQILNIPHTSNSAQAKVAYYALARALHPDKFFHLDDEELKNAVGKIYRRVTESYMILKDDPKRLKYIKDVNGPDRTKKLRFSEDSEAEQKEEAKLATKVCKTPKAEQMFNAAMFDLQNGRIEQAFKGLQTATLFEPGNTELKKILADVGAKRLKPA